MPKLSRFLTSFEYGEISPRLLARVDLAAYNKACKTQENAYSLIHGGATKRRGTLFVGAVKNESQKARLIPFVFSNNTKFMLVLNGGKIQFLKNGAFVESSPGVRYELTMPYSEAELPYVQYAQSGNTMYLAHSNHYPQLLQRVSDTNWTLSNIPFIYDAVSDVTFSNAFVTFKIVNGSNVFQQDEFFTITTVAGAVTAISQVQSPLSALQSVVCSTIGSDITLSGIQTIDGRVLVAGDRVLVKDQTTASQNGIYIVNAGAWTRATDMDSAAECNNVYVRIIGGSTLIDKYYKQTATVTTIGTDALTFEYMEPPGNGQVAGVASMPGSTTSETWTVTCTFSSSSRQEWSVVGSVSGAAVAYWKTGSYPQSVAFFEQRLFFGGSPNFPQHIWGSGAGDYLNFTVGNRDSDGVIVQIAGNDYNAITHMVSARNLMPMTTSTEFSLAGPSQLAISGISSNVIKDHTRHGSNHVKPMRIGREVVFLQRDGKKMRAISYSVTEDANIAPDITIFAEHITRRYSLIDMAFAADPDYIAWCIRADGQLLSLTLAREFETVAWARHKTLGEFEAVGTVPGESADYVYLSVKRTVNGATHRYIEMFDYESDVLDAAYCDSALIYEGAATNTLAGLDHLEGETLVANVNGVYVPDLLVTGGEVTLPMSVTSATVGLPFITQFELLNPEFGNAEQSSQGKTVSIIDIVVRLQDTVHLKINGVVVPFRANSIGTDTAVQPYTGDRSVKSIGWRSPHNILITSETPTPMTILGVVIDAQVNG